MTNNVFFTADTHFFHQNIINYSSRPFHSVEEMNQGLVERWNKVVKPNDAVYHLGDFTLTSRVELVDQILGQLNGTIRLVKGNHDNWVKKLDKLKNHGKIKWVKDYVERWFNVHNQKYKIVMCHFPLLSWHGSHWGSGRGSIMLHGHTHGSVQRFNQNVRRLDVGVDVHDWYPVNLETVISINRDKPSLDHHNV